MSLTDQQKLIRYRNLLVVLAAEIQFHKDEAVMLKDKASKESSPGRRAGLMTQMHCENRFVQRLEKMLSKNRAALKEFFEASDSKEIAKHKIILHR